MRILILQEASRHIENWHYRESQCLARAFRRLGHEAICAGKGYDIFNNIPSVIGLSDAIICIEQYEYSWMPDLRDVKKVKIFWSIDGHCNIYRHKELCKKHSFDIVLNSCMKCVGDMKEYAKVSEWLPNAFCEKINCNNENKRLANIGYCGTLGSPARQSYISKLVSDCGMKKDIMVLGDAMAETLASYKISFNYNLANDINYRTFESMAAGCMLLTNKTPGADTLFDDGIDCVYYNGIGDCIEKAKYYISHDKERISIAKNGYGKAHRLHTYDERAKHIIKLFQKYGGASGYSGD